MGFHIKVVVLIFIILKMISSSFTNKDSDKIVYQLIDIVEEMERKIRLQDEKINLYENSLNESNQKIRDLERTIEKIQEKQDVVTVHNGKLVTMTDLNNIENISFVENALFVGPFVYDLSIIIRNSQNFNRRDNQLIINSSIIINSSKQIISLLKNIKSISFDSILLIVLNERDFIDIMNVGYKTYADKNQKYNEHRRNKNNILYEYKEKTENLYNYVKSLMDILLSNNPSVEITIKYDKNNPQNDTIKKRNSDYQTDNMAKELSIQLFIEYLTTQKNIKKIVLDINDFINDIELDVLKNHCKSNNISLQTKSKQYYDTYNEYTD